MAVLVVELGVAFVETVKPLSHCNFLPTFTQVNFLPDAIAVCPDLVQDDPALTAEKLGCALRIEIPSTAQVASASPFFGFNNILEE